MYVPSDLYVAPSTIDLLPLKFDYTAVEGSLKTFMKYTSLRSDRKELVLLINHSSESVQTIKLVRLEGLQSLWNRSQ